MQLIRREAAIRRALLRSGLRRSLLSHGLRLAENSLKAEKPKPKKSPAFWKSAALWLPRPLPRLWLAMRRRWRMLRLRLILSFAAASSKWFLRRPKI